MPRKKQKNVGPAVSYGQLKQVMNTLEGFTFDLKGKSIRKILRRLMKWNSFASRMLQKNNKSLDEYMARFKKNLYFFFRTLDFFQDLYRCTGFWTTIQQQSGTPSFFEKHEHPRCLLEFLISSRKEYAKTQLGTWLHSSFSQYIQRLVRHWDSVTTEQVHRSGDDNKERLAERCAEWRALLQDGRLADAPELDDLRGRHIIEAQASRPEPLKQHGSFSAMRIEPLIRATAVSVNAEPPHNIKESLESTGKVKKRKKRTSDSESSTAPEKDRNPSKKRSRDGTPEPKKRKKMSRVEGTTPSPEKAPGSASKLAGLDKRLSGSLQLQLQHGSEITSLNSRFQRLTTQLNDIAAVPTSPPASRGSVKSLEKTVSSNAAKLSALGKKVNTLGIEERVVEIDREQLRTVAAEALQNDLHGQLGAHLKELVDGALSRIEGVEERVVEIDREQLRSVAVEALQTDLHSQLGSQLKELVDDAISRVNIGGLVEGAVSRALVQDDIKYRLQRIEQRLDNLPQPQSSTPVQSAPMPQQAHIPQPARMPEQAHSLPQHGQIPQQPEPSIPAQDFAYKAREELIIRQHQSIRTMAEKIQKLEAELNKSKNPEPLATPSLASHHLSGGGNRTSGPLASPSLASQHQYERGSMTGGPFASSSLATHHLSGVGGRTSSPLALPHLASQHHSGGGGRASGPLASPSLSSLHHSGGSRTNGPLDSPSLASHRHSGGGGRASGPLASQSVASYHLSGGGNRISAPLDTPSRASPNQFVGGIRTIGPLDTPSRASQHLFGGGSRASGPLATPSHATQYQSGGSASRLIKFED